MSKIPKFLKIKINTNIAGLQDITYSPSMTLINNEEDNVYFNPLIKLDKNIINKVPQNVRIKQFYEKGLFNSLIFFHGSQKNKTLKQATDEGYVDNNIRVTLDYLFPKMSIIYLKNEPYIIYDVLWSKGDWKIGKRYIKVIEKKYQEIDDNYEITISLILHKGVSISEDDETKLKCSGNWDHVRKAYADMTGKEFVIKPTYSNVGGYRRKKQIKNKINKKTNYNKSIKKIKNRSKSYIRNSTAKRRHNIAHNKTNRKIKLNKTK